MINEFLRQVDAFVTQINGHEYVKRQLAKEGIAFEALDNGVRSCADPKRLQRIADGLSAAKIDALLRKWLARLPHPFTPGDRKAGYRYDVSILQAVAARGLQAQPHQAISQGRPRPAHRDHHQRHA